MPNVARPVTLFTEVFAVSGMSFAVMVTPAGSDDNPVYVSGFGCATGVAPVPLMLSEKNCGNPVGALGACSTIDPSLPFTFPARRNATVAGDAPTLVRTT